MKTNVNFKINNSCKSVMIDYDARLTLIQGDCNSGKTQLLKTIMDNVLTPSIKNQLSIYNPNRIEGELFPIYAYFDADRYAYTSTEICEEYEKSSYLVGWFNHDNPTKNVPYVVAWATNVFSIDIQNKTRKGITDTLFQILLMESTVTRVIPNCTDFYYDFVETDFILSFGSVTVPLKRAGSGHRKTVYLLLDLIYRCCNLNPHL